ncbi:hypothetical protein GWK16_18970 [Roseomonas sp. JC162]|uniref:Uncharacterized protein n=1 Tax=Neoroseomonas marina TaxID=1232220 RepID=A0A848EI70_9PROT|nr:hypothetical protein [Neoroseomonas marina]NMJ43339.1 hypothetical protein [Neoroseomonas marina]
MKRFICNHERVEQVDPGVLDSEVELMSIRRDLLLRSALLRLPDLAALRASTPADSSPGTTMPKRRATYIRVGRRTVSAAAKPLQRAD